jgi:transcription elongation factor SPT6
MQMALEINVEPSMFEYVHKIPMDNKVFSIKPTTQGNSAIDSFHSYASVKWKD